MNKKIFLPILLSIFIGSCWLDQDSLTPKVKNDITDTLEKIAIENLRSWEPPFYEEKVLQSFTQSNDFSLVIDGFKIQDYKKWKSIVIESMQHDRENYKQYKHIIKDICTAVLSQNSGVVTLNYVWDYITKDDLHYNTPAAVTLTFKLENHKWKIIHFHCSHGETKQIKKQNKFSK